MKYFILISFLSSSLIGFAQKSGYFNKRNLISINGTGSHPLIYNVLSGFFDEEIYYKSNNGTLNEDIDMFNGGFNLAFTRYSSERFGYGLEFNMNFSNCKGPNGATYYTYIRLEDTIPLRFSFNMKN